MSAKDMSADLDLDWHAWLRRWDAQQQGYAPERAVMLDAVADLLPAAFVAVDLGCGPGAIAQRLLQRFPRARVVAVDLDPVMIALGRGALGTMAGRLRWVETDIADPQWLTALGEPQVDAVLSTTALHWLSASELTRLYADLGRLLRPGGVFLNGDNLGFPAQLPTFDRLAQRVSARQWSDAAFAARGIETAEQWWEALGREPAMAALIAERTRRFAGKQRLAPVDVETHVRALDAAGFGEVGTVWQVLSDRVLLALR
ncbi:class I SAM-dependent methyltransferase [Nocardia yunnanensis]|uniref:Class I SAM-dependent methyltransferase n=1 Tax=Nocardia yunnanensis TaxID=2382165 RepID=A0A386ZGL4_9NOCA|nr:class I SAM-dependent methyltransferase [Nocardia yunnanensis]AYF75745.1 class I SAM-dependent methyltransferase [Nocardia yunnanensis]